MKRKLISFEAFGKLQEGSLSKAEEELMAAEDILGKTLGVDVELFCYGESDVTYQTADGTFIHAVYKIENDQVILENIEELVIEEESAKKETRKMVANMVDAILENNDAKATSIFDEYFHSPTVKRDLVNEGFKVTVSKPTGKFSKLRHKKQSRTLVAKRTRERLKTLKKLSPSKKTELSRKRGLAAKKIGGSSNPRWRTYARKIKNMNEWAVMCENVVDYIDYKEFGPVFKNSAVRADDRGNVTDVAIPTSTKRNEGKILSFNWKTLDHEVKILRNGAKKITEDQVFIRAMADLKRYNGISDNSALEETLEAIVSRWPDVLYLTQNELAINISEALTVANVKNYDDDTCLFMAEAILRTAHHAYTDRVKKIANVAGVSTDVTSECKDCQDAYVEFKNVADRLFKQLDESDNADLKVFSDLYKALHEIHKIANESGDEVTKVETADLMSDCEAILNREAKPNLEIAEQIANYLQDLLEANVDGASEDWDISNSVHNTVNGDHPRMNWAAKQTDAVPSNHLGDWGDEAPVSDGKSFKGGLADEMRNRSWGNIGGEGTYPSLKNPYVPEPFGDYTMKGEDGAEKAGTDDWSRWQSEDTWPNLKNPYVPKEAGGTGGTGYKMKSDNLIVDK